MANLNKVILIGRLTRDPEFKTFGNGGKVAKLGFAVSNRKKNAQGEWEDDPMFIDCEVYNRGEMGKQADVLENSWREGSLHKGSQLCIEGRLQLDRWEKDGQKQSKHKIVVDNFQFLDPKAGGGEEGGGRPMARSAAPARSNGGGRGGYAPSHDDDFGGGDEPPARPSRGRAPAKADDDDIPF